MKHIKYIAAGLGLLMLAGCKPTEKNYKAAYDAAMARRAADEATMLADMPDMMAAIDMDAPRRVDVGADTVLVKTKSLAPIDTFNMLPYNVTVAIYKMSTNAKAHSERLRQEGYNSYVLKDNEGQFYTVSEAFDSLEPTPASIRRYVETHKSDMYVGLPSSPVVYVPAGARLSN